MAYASFHVLTRSRFGGRLGLLSRGSPQRERKYPTRYISNDRDRLVAFDDLHSLACGSAIIILLTAGRWRLDCIRRYYFVRVIGIVIRECAVPESILKRILRPASVDNRCLRNRFTHGPVEQPILREIGENTTVKTPLKTVFTNVPHKCLKKLRVNPVSNQILVRPVRHGLCECPFLRINEFSKRRWQSLSFAHHSARRWWGHG